MISYGVCRANEGTIMMRPIDHIAFSVFKLAITSDGTSFAAKLRRHKVPY